MIHVPADYLCDIGAGMRGPIPSCCWSTSIWRMGSSPLSPALHHRHLCSLNHPRPLPPTPPIFPLCHQNTSARGLLCKSRLRITDCSVVVVSHQCDRPWRAPPPSHPAQFLNLNNVREIIINLLHTVHTP